MTILRTISSKLCAAALAALFSVATSHALIIDVKALYSDRYSIESVEVTNLANGASVTLEPGQTLALDSAEPRTADVRLPFVDGDDVRFTARATDGEVTVITERPDDDHTVWVHFINTLDSSGNRHIVNKIGGLYYLTDIDNPDALVNKSWQRPTADDLKATSEYFNNTKLRGLRYEKRLAQDATLCRGLRAFGATAEGATTDVGNVVVSRDREANHRAMIATMLGYDPAEAEPATPKPYRDGKNTLNICEKRLAFPGLNLLDGTDLSFGADLPNNAITDYTYSYDDEWDMVIPKTYSPWSGKEYIMTLYGKRGQDLQLVIYKPNDDGSFTEEKRFSFADHLDYTRYDDVTWINEYPDQPDLLAEYRTQISDEMPRRRYRPMQAAEAETGLCQAGEFVFVIQGCNITKINTTTGDISTSTLPDISTNARVTWAMVVYDLNGDGFDDVLAFADDEGKNELSSIVTYGSADGFTGDFIKQVIATDDDTWLLAPDKTIIHSVNRLPRSVAASIVYPNGYYGNPYIYLATTPILNCSLQEGETIITARFFRMELTDENRNFWDGSLSKETLSNTYWDNLTYDTVADSNYEWDFYWRSKIEPVYFGGICSGIEPIIITNCNRAYSADFTKSNLLYCYGQAHGGKNNIIDIHFDQFDACGENSEIPMPTCCIIFSYGPGGAELSRYLYPCAITEIPSGDYKAWSSKNGPEYIYGWRIDRNPESGNTGFASIPYRNKEGVTLEYVCHDVTASNPSIFFVLAAPPFNEYTAADGGASAASFCSKSETSGSEEKNSESKTAKGGVSVSFGLGEYFKLGSDHTFTREWNTAFSKTSSTTYMQDFRVEGSHDGVNFNFVPVDRYTYRVCATDDPNVTVGETMQIYNMRDEQPRTSTWRLSTYNERLYGTGLPTIDNNLLPHEPGNIGSYRHIKPDFTTKELCELFNIDESDLVGFTPTDINPGDAGRSTVQISIANGNGQSAGSSFTYDLEMSFGFNLGSVFGLTAKGGTSETTAWSRTTTWSETTAMGGVVPAVKDVDYQYLCRQVFYRRHIKDDTGKDMQDYLVNNWVVVGNETANNHLVPELTINGITEVGDGIYTVDLTLSGRKDLSTSATETADIQGSKIGLDHFMLENTIDGTVWYDANTTIVDGEARQESFDLSNAGAYDQYEATRDFKHDYLILNDEQLEQLEDYSAGVSETPVVATYRLTVSDAVGNYKNVTAQIEIPKTGNVGITDIDAARGLRATATDGDIHVSGAAPLSRVSVCDLAGRPVAVVAADATGHATISGAPRGVVLVTNATGIAKLHVK